MNCQRQGRLFDTSPANRPFGDSPADLMTAHQFAHHSSSHHNTTQRPNRSQSTVSTPLLERHHNGCTTRKISTGTREEDPLQNTRPPEEAIQSRQENVTPRIKNNQSSQGHFVSRAKRLSARISGRASLLLGGVHNDLVPPPVPRHRNQSKYNHTSSDANHMRLFEPRARSYTCRELLCIVFLPCILISLLGIALSSIIIYYQMGKEYESEISTLEQELAISREKDGVYLDSHKYQSLIAAANNQKVQSSTYQVELEELEEKIKIKDAKIEELTEKSSEMKNTLDCTYTVIQSEGVLLEKLENTCKLSQRAQLLLAVSDQAVDYGTNGLFPPKHSLSSAPDAVANKHLHPHHKSASDPSGHWLLGTQKRENGESGEFQQYLVTELSRMEQSILDFSKHHETFCSEFRHSIEREVERRRHELTGLSNKLSSLIDNQAKAVGKLESLASEQMYAEQKWMTSYLKNTRNEADRQSTTLQGFLTDSFLPETVSIAKSVQELSTALSLFQSNLKMKVQISSNTINAFLDSQKKLITSTKDTVTSLSNIQQREFQALLEKQGDIVKNENQFGLKFMETKKKIDGLLDTMMSEYNHYSRAMNKTLLKSGHLLSSLNSRNQQIASSVSISSTEAEKSLEALRSKNIDQNLHLLEESTKVFSESESQTKTVLGRLNSLELQTKQMVGEKQGAWELHYANSEIMLRKKSDKNKELLQKHQSQTQETLADLRQFRNQLEVLGETQKEMDKTHSVDRQADLQAQCKSLSAFTHLLTRELHARDSDLAKYFENRHRK